MQGCFGAAAERELHMSRTGLIDNLGRLQALGSPARCHRLPWRKLGREDVGFAFVEYQSALLTQNMNRNSCTKVMAEEVSAVH